MRYLENKLRCSKQLLRSARGSAWDRFEKVLKYEVKREKYYSMWLEMADAETRTIS